jgi:hypothetical protein
MEEGGSRPKRGDRFKSGCKKKGCIDVGGLTTELTGLLLNVEGLGWRGEALPLEGLRVRKVKDVF